MSDNTYGYENSHLHIVSRDILRRHHVNEPGDTRFASCARLLQSIWRREPRLGTGLASEPGRTPAHPRQPPRSRRRPPGAATSSPPDIARLTRRATAYREIGAFIEEQRLWENLLSSQPLTFNLFAHCQTAPDHGLALFNHLFPGFFGQVGKFAFEHSPGRGDPTYLGDYTALYQRALGLTHGVFSAVWNADSMVRGGFAPMAAAVKLRTDYSASDLRQLAAASKHANQSRRLLSLAAVVDGMDRQTLRDWVHRFNEQGPDGLWDIRSKGHPPRLTAAQLTELAAIVESGPDRAVHGVVRWRRVDLRHVVLDRFGVDYHERTVGKILKALGFSHISARPRHPGQDPNVMEEFKKTLPGR